MNRKGWLVLFICLLTNIFAGEILAQSPDTIQKSAPLKKDHRPRNAAIRSAIIPGWGQAYNRSYWKIPVLYAAGGTITYFYLHNASIYRENRDLLKHDPNSPNADVYRINRDRFREYRDWNIAMMVGLYILNIIDANVDAHLKEFDINEELSFNVKPYIYRDLYNNRPITGITLNFRFKK